MGIFDDWPEPEQEHDFKCPCCGHDKYKPINVIHNSTRIFLHEKKPSGVTTVVKTRETMTTERKTQDVAECSNCSHHIILNTVIEIISKADQKKHRDNMNKYKFEKDKQTGFLAPEQL